MPGKIFIVSAPSGAGKTTLVTKAIEELCLQ
jgi:guanylate kinase